MSRANRLLAILLDYGVHCRIYGNADNPFFRVDYSVRLELGPACGASLVCLDLALLFNRDISWICLLGEISDKGNQGKGSNGSQTPEEGVELIDGRGSFSDILLLLRVVEGLYDVWIAHGYRLGLLGTVAEGPNAETADADDRGNIKDGYGELAYKVTGAVCFGIGDLPGNNVPVEVEEMEAENPSGDSYGAPGNDLGLVPEKNEEGGEEVTKDQPHADPPPTV